MKSLDKTQEKLNIISSSNKKNHEEIDNIIADLFSYFDGTNIPIMGNLNMGRTCVFDAVDDYNYIEVEGISRDADGIVYVETDTFNFQLSELSIENKKLIAEWIMEEIENPDAFGLDDDDDDEDVEDETTD